LEGTYKGQARDNNPRSVTSVGTETWQTRNGKTTFTSRSEGSSMETTGEVVGVDGRDLVVKYESTYWGMKFRGTGTYRFDETCSTYTGTWRSSGSGTWWGSRIGGPAVVKRPAGDCRPSDLEVAARLAIEAAKREGREPDPALVMQVNLLARERGNNGCPDADLARPQTIASVKPPAVDNPSAGGQNVPANATALTRPSGACPSGFQWIGGYLCAAYNVSSSWCASNGGRFIDPKIGGAPTRCEVASATGGAAPGTSAGATGGTSTRTPVGTTYGGAPAAAGSGQRTANASENLREALRQAIARRSPMRRLPPFAVDEETKRSLSPREQEALFLLARLQSVSFVDELGDLVLRLDALTARFPAGRQKDALQQAAQYYRNLHEAELALIAEEEARRNPTEAPLPVVELSPEIRAWFASRPRPGDYPNMSEEDCRYWKGIYGRMTGCLIQPYGENVGKSGLRMLMIVDDAVSITEDPAGRTVKAIVGEFAGR